MSAPVLDQILSFPNLPTPPAIALQILELTRDPQVTASKLAKLVQNDPALSAKVLRTVNSSLFGLPQQCTKVERALALLGMNAAKSLVLGFSLVDCTRAVKGGSGLNLQEHWRRAIYTAAAARNLALATTSCDPDEAFTAGVFQDIGVLAAFLALGPKYAGILTTAPQTHDELPGHELTQLGVTHPDIGGALAQRWKLPDRYVAAIRAHHDPDAAPPEDKALARVVHLGNVVAESFGTAAPGSYVVRLLRTMRSWYGLDTDEIEGLLNRAAQGGRDLAIVFEKDVGTPPDLDHILAEARDRQVEAAVATSRQTDELLVRNQELARAAVTDALTGAGNRKAFDQEIAAAFAAASSQRRHLAVLFADADKFKSVNDRFGHPAGDAVLVELGRRLRERVGARGSVFRYGGEEFVVVAPGLDRAQAAALAEDVRHAIEAPPFDLSKVPGAPGTLPVTISIGAAVLEAGVGFASPIELVKAADEAVYASKQAGRNRVTMSAAGTRPIVVDPAPALVPANPPPAASAAPRSRVRVLLVDDDALAGKLLQLALQKRPNVDVVWASSAPEAEELLAKAPAQPAFDLVVADMKLGRGTGIDVARRVRSSPSSASVPVLLISADDATPVPWQQAGATGFVNKRELCTNLNGWIDRLLKDWLKAA